MRLGRLRLRGGGFGALGWGFRLRLCLPEVQDNGIWDLQKSPLFRGPHHDIVRILQGDSCFWKIVCQLHKSLACSKLQRERATSCRNLKLITCTTAGVMRGMAHTISSFASTTILLGSNASTAGAVCCEACSRDTSGMNSFQTR